ARQQRYQHRRRRSRPGHAHAHGSLRCAAQRSAHDATCAPNSNTTLATIIAYVGADPFVRPAKRIERTRAIPFAAIFSTSGPGRMRPGLRVLLTILYNPAPIARNFSR